MAEHFEMKVIEFAAGVTIPSDVFELVFPANAIVFKNDPSGGYHTRVLANGEFERISSAEAVSALDARPKRRNYTGS